MQFKPDADLRRVNAERIASVIGDRRFHAFQKHGEEIRSGLGVDHFEPFHLRRIITDTLLDPDTRVIDEGHGRHIFYNPARNIMVMVDPHSRDWGTAFMPDGNRGRTILAARGNVMQRNGDVAYLERMNPGFFSAQDRLRSASPVNYAAAPARRAAEIALRVFDKFGIGDGARGETLRNAFNAAGYNLSRDRVERIRMLPAADKTALATYAAELKEIDAAQQLTLKRSGLGSLKDDGGRQIDVAATLRDPSKREALLDRLETDFAETADPAEERRLETMINAAHSFLGDEDRRDSILDHAAQLLGAGSDAARRPGFRQRGPAEHPAPSVRQ